jgi:hypothetical protein
MVTLIIVLALIAYGLFHRHHYRQNRRAGFGVFYSLRGPWGIAIRVSKRF